MMECPFCNEAVCESDLAFHVWTWHAFAIPGKEFFRAVQGELGCYCDYLAESPEAMLKHWEDGGGLRAHILDLTLGDV